VPHSTAVSGPGWQIPLVEWFANNYERFGATLEFVTNRSQEGTQFVRGFGGVGGILRWKVDFAEMDHEQFAGDDGDDDDDGAHDAEDMGF
jgi:peptide chain release factor subunit 1